MSVIKLSPYSSYETDAAINMKIKQYLLEHGRKFTEHKKYWVLAILNTIAVIAGQSAAILLSRYYFDKGGNSRWLSTLLQVVGWPIFLLPLFWREIGEITPLSWRLLVIYIVLGVVVAGDDLLYSWGVSYVPASTYSLICSSQLAFNVIFSFFLNKQRITFYILNSVVILTFAAVLLGIYSNGDRPKGVTNVQYFLGFLCTLAASALYGLLLPLMQLTFQKVLKKESFAVVLEMNIYTSAVATAICVVGLFASGEFRDVGKEAGNFTDGKLAYWMTVIWSAIGWQVTSVGAYGLIFLVSSLFSNVVSTLALPVVPILSVGFFHDKVTAIKVISLLLSIWGFVSYVHGGYKESETLESPRVQSEQHTESVV